MCKWNCTVQTKGAQGSTVFHVLTWSTKSMSLPRLIVGLCVNHRAQGMNQKEAPPMFLTWESWAVKGFLSGHGRVRGCREGKTPNSPQFVL